MMNVPSPPSQYPSALLILVTGLPAAGKSTFLAAAQRHVFQCGDSSGKVSLFGGRCHGRISSVLQLDKVLADLERETASDIDFAASAGDHKFSPLLWRRATRRLLKLTQSALCTCVAETADSDATQDVVVPMVFVEDNMHYRSMRARYYQMCRALERGEQPVQTPRDTPAATVQASHRFIGVFELRFVTPLAVCLARNAQRGVPRKGSDEEQMHASAWVPPAVICSMDALFDHCYAADDRLDRIVGAPCDSKAWQWTATTQPWGLLVYASQAVSEEMLPAAPEETAVGFFDVALQQPEAWDMCQRQRQDAARTRLTCLRGDEHLDETTRLSRAAEAVESHAHQLDLQLRRVIHAFLQQRYHLQAHGTENAPSSRQRSAMLRKHMVVAKQEAAQSFKVQLRQLCTANTDVANTTAVERLSSSIDDVQELVVQQFQQRVLDLWRALEACALPASRMTSTRK
ncbi:hypothetical protein LSCM1_00587 [Leishmania martiniquensis]|uniref:L-seryl-tRNA(Sec) kinase n=1 Tax=Leishmania martiniquensis TaxID=1580590 RepID=A0A836GIC2_9TRYP|nr:hypothetical protein LSCM1_00587 [Leishmania martiniquensis]